MFKRSATGGVVVRIRPAEREVLISLLHQLVGLVAGEPAQSDDLLAGLVGSLNPVPTPTDPALLRLLPDAHRSDAEAAAEFRRFTEPGLRQRKQQAAQNMAQALRSEGKFEISPSQAQEWLTAINDLRLVIGTRIGITDAGIDESLFAKDRTAALYGWLTYLQSQLIAAIN